MEDIEATLVVIPEQNRKRTKKTPIKVRENRAAQVPETFPKGGALQTDDDDASTGRAFLINPDTIGPMLADTKEPNRPGAATGAVNKPKAIEHCANAAQAKMTSYKVSKMARPEAVPPECNPESDNPCSSSRQRFVEPTDKLPMTATAWDRIHIFAGMASNKMVQSVQPFRTRKPDETRDPDPQHCGRSGLQANHL